MSTFDDAMSLLTEEEVDAVASLAHDLAVQDEAFLANLVDHRAAAGLTQADLAAAWGRHKTAVSQFEQLGHDPKLSTIRRYAASVGARYKHVVYLDENVHRPVHAAPIKATYADGTEQFDDWSEYEMQVGQ